MNKLNRLLIFANDAASANVTMAYSYIYKDKYSEILAYPNGAASIIYKEHIQHYISNSSYNFLSTDTVVLGTSGIDASFEMNLLIKAKKAGVKTIIIIVDNISNFNMRFTINNKIIDKIYLPNEIWIFTKNFQSDYEHINNKLIYKENIYYQFLKQKYTNKPPLIKHKFVKKYKNKYLVILTEYIYELYGLQFGFTEYDIVENILQVVNNLNLSIPIFLKLHPRENKNKFNILLRKYNKVNIINDNCNIQELIYYSKLIFGIRSSVFIECKLFQKPVFSIQIGSNNKTTNNIITIIYSLEDLKEILKKYFLNS